MLELTRTRLLLIVTAVIAVHAAVIAHRRVSDAGDFDISREFGRRLLAHEELYAGGLHYPYLPAAALSFAPLALVPASVGFALRYLLALACLALTLHWLFALMQRWHPHVRGQRLVLAAATLVLALPYILRDLDDGGPHLILLALVAGGLICATGGRVVLAASCIGLATVLKAPHGLLIPFFLLNRQTRLAGWSAVATIAWMLAPLPWMGATSWYQHHAQWAQAAFASVRLAPTAAVAMQSEARVQNQSLPAVVTRWAQQWKDGDTARWMGRVAALVLLLAVAWCTRGTHPDDPRWLPNASVVLIATALLAPVAWVQHLVLVIPALYVLAARRSSPAAARSLPVNAALLAYIVLALVLNREVLGRESYLVLLTGGLHTCAMFIVLALVIATYPPPAGGRQTS